MDDPAPDLSAAVVLGCLPLPVAHDAPAAAFAAPEGQPRLDDAAHVEWLSGATISDPLRGFPACHVVRVAHGQSMRQAHGPRGNDCPGCCEAPGLFLCKSAMKSYNVSKALTGLYDD